MTQATHTPGPWSFRTTGWSTNPFAIHSPRRPGAVACVPSRTSVPLDEQDANARLIAAAPELLAALDELLGDVELLNEPYRNEAICERARAAIAKAKGK